MAPCKHACCVRHTSRFAACLLLQEATRSALQGAQSIAWWLDHYEPRLNGSVYVDGVPLDW